MDEDGCICIAVPARSENKKGDEEVDDMTLEKPDAEKKKFYRTYQCFDSVNRVGQFVSEHL